MCPPAQKQTQRMWRHNLFCFARFSFSTKAVMKTVLFLLFFFYGLREVAYGEVNHDKTAVQLLNIAFEYCYH